MSSRDNVMGELPVSSNVLVAIGSCIGVVVVSGVKRSVWVDVLKSSAVGVGYTSIHTAVGASVVRFKASEAKARELALDVVFEVCAECT